MPARTVYLETFGCQMNELDSTLVAGRLRALGYTFTHDPAAADVILYNTCSVREHAEQKVWSRLGELAARKAAEPSLVVGVLGCLAERDGEALIDRMPVVDVLCGPGELDRLPTLLDNAVRTSIARSTLRATEGASATSVPPDAHRPSSAHPRAALRATEVASATSVPPDTHRPSSATRPLVSARHVALQGNTSRRSATLAAAEDTLELLDLSRAVSPDDHAGSAYVRITRGCNKFCTYCVVPYTRGAEVHRPPDHIVDECRRLADAGVIEITLLGQTVNHYRFEHGAAVSINGITQPQKGRAWNGSPRPTSDVPHPTTRTTSFADLLARIHDEVPAIRRLRFVTSYPRDFGDDVLQVIRDHPRICRYLHAPAQSGSDRILRLMNRGYSVAEYLEFLDRARAYLHQPRIGRPLTVAGDVIVGFPTESDEDFESSRSLLRRARYKNCFIFKYSPRPGTAAYDRLPDDVPESVKRRRNNDLLALQESISRQVMAEYLGQTVDVFVTGLSPRERKKQRPLRSLAGAGAPRLTIDGREIALPAPAPTATADTDPIADAPPQMTGRTDGDLIVVFDAPRASRPDDLIGRILPVRITGASALALTGVVVA